jgi:hypothetical protein
MAGIRWETGDRKLGAEIAAVIERVAGSGPTRIEGVETLRVFKLEWPQQPFMARRLAPMHLPKERHTELTYRPHRVEVLSMASWLNVTGGRWQGGALPEIHRDALPALTVEQAARITDEVETLFNQRGALPWV